MSRQKFTVAIPNDEGGIILFPMKEWLRKHPDKMPPDIDPNPSNSNSRQLFAGLKKMGWTYQEFDEEIRLFGPDTPIQKIEENEEDEELDTSFALESQLQDFLASNIERIPINGMKLKLYKDSDGRSGKEFATNEVGRIDILAVDEKGDYLVCELKRAETPDKTIGQLTRYMGWVKKTIGKGKKVRGVIVAGKIDNYLRYSIEALSDVSLFEYEISFKLNPVKGFD